MVKRGIVIALDGPAGSGKSSVTREIARIFGLVHIDTGAMYRSVALLALRQCLSPRDPLFADKVTELTKQMDYRFQGDRIFLYGEDVTQAIRSSEVTQFVSEVAVVEGVRIALVILQRTLGCQADSILEGRDIGTVVFPDADLKIYLSASLEARSVRRLEQMKQESHAVPSSFIDINQVKHGIENRDEKDKKRAVAPLIKAVDAYEIDSTHLSFSNVVEKIASLVEGRMPSYGAYTIAHGCERVSDG